MSSCKSTITNIGNRVFNGTAIESSTIPKSVTTMSGSGSSSCYYSPFDGVMNLKRANQK